jgi:ABC-type iron transport system FetAB permease component
MHCQPPTANVTLSHLFDASSKENGFIAGAVALGGANLSAEVSRETAVLLGKVRKACKACIPLGTIICGENIQDRSVISRHFSHQILTRGQVAQCLARLRCTPKQCTNKQQDKKHEKTDSKP